VPASGSGTVTVGYTHDAWNRLVKVEYDQTVRAKYRYNGLNWRIAKLADTSVPVGRRDIPAVHVSIEPHGLDRHIGVIALKSGC
jgi:hypothetical protein